MRHASFNSCYSEVGLAACPSEVNIEDRVTIGRGHGNLFGNVRMPCMNGIA